jgi:glycerophosphoryl diester phosphodiesterase
MTHAAALVAAPIAHRGLHDSAKGLVENTLSAARAAIAGGFGIECDLQLSADGEAVVFHDFTLERLTKGAGDIGARKAADLAAIPLKGTADRIPTLADLLHLVAGRVPLIIEVKSRFDGDMRLVRRTVEQVTGYDGPVGIKSFDAEVVAELRQIAPDIPRGIVAQLDYSYPDYASLGAAEKHALANLLHYPESLPHFVSWQVRDLPSAAPFLCRTALGLPVMAWTVRTPEDRARAAKHADQMVFEGFHP